MTKNTLHKILGVILPVVFICICTFVVVVCTRSYTDVNSDVLREANEQLMETESTESEMVSMPSSFKYIGNDTYENSDATERIKITFQKNVSNSSKKEKYESVIIAQYGSIDKASQKVIGSNTWNIYKMCDEDKTVVYTSFSKEWSCMICITNTYDTELSESEAMIIKSIKI